MALEYQIRHALPGRIRLFVPAIKRFDALADACVEVLKRQEGITDVRVNRTCASLVISYNPDSERFLSRLEAGLGLLTPQMIIAIAAARQKSDGRKKMPARENSTGGPGITAASLKPMALPTLSLGFSLIGGPVGAAVTLPLIAYNALPTLKRASSVLWNENRLNVDFLDGLAITIATLRGSFFTSAFMSWLISLGDAIRDHTAAKSKRAIEGLLDYQGRTAWVVRGKRKVEVKASQLAPCDIVAVYPGGMIPIDGEVIKGRAIVDQKTITGESMPVHLRPGDKVYAATVVRDGKLYIKTLRAGTDTTAAQIVRLVEEAPVGETRIQNYAEKFADKLVAP
ncbi:MAG TPA: heavy metal translocating P-type ATPase, partial [Blastocatellia bacterium]|nr:heavy metal translocating P-type ATPase [Blastocatellia bacterium]